MGKSSFIKPLRPAMNKCALKFLFVFAPLFAALPMHAAAPDRSPLEALSRCEVPEYYSGKRAIYENLNTAFGIPYKYADGELLRFDISYPEGPAPLAGFPLIMYFHGGGFAGGERFSGYGYYNDEIRWYNSKGIAVATVSYRFARHFPKRTMLACVTDAKDAARFMVKYAKELKLNPNKMGVYGHSAGGQLTYLTALSGDSDFPGDESLKGVKVRFVCAVPQSGPSDLVDPEADAPGSFISQESNMRGPLGGKIADNVELRKMMSPARYLKRGAPAMLILQGEKDSIVPKEAAIYMEKKARALGVPVELVISEGAGHSFENAKNPDNGGLARIRREFFARHLAGGK